MSVRVRREEEVQREDSLDGVTSLPNHTDNGAGVHVAIAIDED
jgi:hypothetical protein